MLAVGGQGKRRTDLLGLLPAPRVVVIDDAIVAMTTVHLAGLGAQLIELDPVLFDHFAMEMPGVRLVSLREQIHAIVLVVLNVNGGDDSSSACDCLNQGRPFLAKASDYVPEVATGNIIRQDKVARGDMPE